jgi:G3E family GTPase
MTPQRIPIYLLTGFLGSGKTSLLKEWLREDILSKAALIINELGEVGLDNQLLTPATESQSLLANACVCCTGLLGLSQALEEIFWARLERRMPRFPNVVIETTGLANPGPILETLQGNELLQERYTWGGTITCLSAPTAQAVLSTHPEARAQLNKANVCIITKTDQVSASALASLRLQLHWQVQEHNRDCLFLTSAQASLGAAAVLDALLKSAPIPAGVSEPHPGVTASDPSCPPCPPCPSGHSETVGADVASTAHLASHHPEHHAHHVKEDHQHRHHAQALWWPLAHSDTQALSEADLRTQIEQLQDLLGSTLLRLKGRVSTSEGLRLVQMAPFDAAPTVSVDTLELAQKPEDAAPPPWGLTVIVGPMGSVQETRVLQHLGVYKPENT